MSDEKLLIDIVADSLDVDVEDIDLKSGPSNTPDWDSVNTLRILTGIEDDFDVHLPLTDYLKTKNVGELLELIKLEKTQEGK